MSWPEPRQGQWEWRGGGILKSYYDGDGLCTTGNSARSGASWQEQHVAHTPSEEEPPACGNDLTASACDTKRVVGDQQPPGVFGLW